MKLPLIIAFVFASALNLSVGQVTAKPQLHFTAPQNWINDPNGMVYYDGEYHLFYQHNPFGNTWGHMSWGHAVSRDLVKWEHLPIALYEEDEVMVYSGSAVVDAANTSGFAKPGETVLVAIYTDHDSKRKLETQSIAYSVDKGRTWTRYEGNPVLDLGMENFRDPKVFWYEPGGYWVMTIVKPFERVAQFYRSADLKEWSLLSEFGPAGAVRGIWECPDLFELPTPDGEVKWVLNINIGDASVAGGSGAQYFIGHFDGERFIPDQLPESSDGSASRDVEGGSVLAHFEDGFGGWNVVGDAFASSREASAVEGYKPLVGAVGGAYIDGRMRGDRTTGRLASPSFEITHPYLNFKLGGGSDSTLLPVMLISDEERIHTATGHNGNELLWKSWDVSELMGQEAQIVVLDRKEGEWGHLNLDHFVLSDQPVDELAEAANWVDYGKDFYAAVTWSNAPDGRKLWLAWMSNWQYANETPTEGWRSAMSFPRELSLVEIDGELRLRQVPVEEIADYRGSPVVYKDRGVSSGPVVVDGVETTSYEVKLTLTPGAVPAGIGLFTQDGKSVRIGFDPVTSTVYMERGSDAVDNFHPKFPATMRMPVRLRGGKVELYLIVDRCSVEIFAEQGTRCMTGLLFPEPSSRKIELFGEGAIVDSLVVYPHRPVH